MFDFYLIGTGEARAQQAAGRLDLTFDGDAKTDLAVFRDGTWYILQSSNRQPRYVYWGLNSDRVVPADYDGDGKADAAVFREGIWYLMESSSGQTRIRYFGLPGDAPVPNALVR